MTYLLTNLTKQKQKQNSFVVSDLMWSELGIVQFLDSILHVLVVYKLHNSSAVVEHICIADVSGFTHVVLQILPAASRGKTCHVQMQHSPDRWESRPDTQGSSRHDARIQCYQVDPSSESRTVLRTAIPDSEMCYTVRQIAFPQHFIQKLKFTFQECMNGFPEHSIQLIQFYIKPCWHFQKMISAIFPPEMRLELVYFLKRNPVTIPASLFLHRIIPELSLGQGTSGFIPSSSLH